MSGNCKPSKKQRLFARVCLALLLSAFVGLTSLSLQPADTQPEQVAVNWNS